MESKLMVSRGFGVGEEKGWWSKGPTSSYKMSKFCRPDVQHGGHN